MQPEQLVEQTCRDAHPPECGVGAPPGKNSVRGAEVMRNLKAQHSAASSDAKHLFDHRQYLSAIALVLKNVFTDN